MAKFEAHITFHRADRMVVKDIGEVHGWSYSAFDADPIMGDKPYCYLTAYDPDSDKLLARMKSVATGCSAMDVLILRQKIETHHL